MARKNQNSSSKTRYIIISLLIIGSFYFGWHLGSGPRGMELLVFCTLTLILGVVLGWFSYRVFWFLKSKPSFQMMGYHNSKIGGKPELKLVRNNEPEGTICEVCRAHVD